VVKENTQLGQSIEIDARHSIYPESLPQLRTQYHTFDQDYQSEEILPSQQASVQLRAVDAVLIFLRMIIEEVQQSEKEKTDLDLA
jgi:hypothetical protein